jgi:predicted metalloprotease
VLVWLVFMAFGERAEVTAHQSNTPSAESYRGSDEEFRYAGTFQEIAVAIDAFWETAFSRAAIPYSSPAIESLDRLLNTACGRHGPSSAAIYCQLDKTIYLAPDFLAEQNSEIGDYAPIIVLAHEWGHHVQNLLQVPDPGDNKYELQADCLAGAFTLDAETQGLLEKGDLAEAVLMSESVGDPAGLPQDQPGAHGTDEDRRRAVLRGYLDGLAGCNLPDIEIVIIEETPEENLACAIDLLNCLPRVPPLDHAACFGVVDDGTEDFEQLLNRFSGIPDAVNLLEEWGWQATAFRQFGCDGPPDGDAGWIDISAHLFADATSAQQAVDYFTAVRLDGSPYVQGVSPGIGDYSTAMAGPAVNGKDFTIYASQGPYLVRVTGVSPSGTPFMNVLTVAQTVLADIQGMPETPLPTPTQDAARPASAYLPAIPGVRHRDCFDIQTEGSYAYSEVAEALQATGLSQSQFTDLGWRDGAYVVFVCDEPPAGRAAQIDIGIHQLQDEASARQALPYFSIMFEVEDNHHRDCDVARNLVVCVSARSLTGSPLSDVAFVLQQVVGAAR